MNKNNISTDTSDDYYFDDKGRLVYKASFHLNRGSCCFKYCLHCPYGTTVEKFGIKCNEIKDEGKLLFYIKGIHCATFDFKSKNLNIFDHFKNQGIENDINSTLHIFYEGKDEQ